MPSARSSASCDSGSASSPGNAWFASSRRSRAGLRDDPAVKRQMREAYRINDAAVLEVLKMFDRRQDPAMLLAHVEVDGIALLQQALEAGRGAILLATHAGNSALLVIRLAAAGIPVSMVFRESRMMDAGLFERGLSFYGVEGILATEGLKAYGRMLGALRSNRVVFIMADQGVKKARDGMVFRFLGKDMPMPAGPAQLARHADAPVLPVATVAVEPVWRFEIRSPIPRQADASLESRRRRPVARQRADDPEQSAVVELASPSLATISARGRRGPGRRRPALDGLASSFPTILAAV